MLNDSKETICSRYYRTDARMSSQRLWQHTWDLHRIKPDTIAAMKIGNGHKVPSQSKKLFITDTLLGKEKIGFLWWSITAIILTHALHFFVNFMHEFDDNNHVCPPIPSSSSSTPTNFQPHVFLEILRFCFVFYIFRKLCHTVALYIVR